MSTKLNEADWEIALEVFRACLPAWGANRLHSALGGVTPAKAAEQLKPELLPRNWTVLSANFLAMSEAGRARKINGIRGQHSH